VKKLLDVLIVEDSAADVVLLKHFFESRSFCNRIDYASTIKEGKALFDKGSYDMVILDIELPDGSGLDLADIINKKRDDDSIIICLSGHKEDKYAKEANSHGVDGYLVKPLSMPFLEALVKQVEKLHFGLMTEVKRKPKKKKGYFFSLFAASSLMLSSYGCGANGCDINYLNLTPDQLTKVVI